jgi:hypothetical protein
MARLAPVRHNAARKELRGNEISRALPGRLTLAALRALWSEPAKIAVDPAAKAPSMLPRARSSTWSRPVRRFMASTPGSASRPNANRRCAARELQRALVLSHSAGTGPLIDDAVCA